MGKKVIYFDNAATSGIKPPSVIKAICECINKRNANPGRSGHSLSVKAVEIIYNCREKIGELFNFDKTENIILTKNATESLNIVINGILNTGDEVITTSMEHNSVLRPLTYLKEKRRIKVTIINADLNGQINPKNIYTSLTDKTKLIVITSASNVTGTKMNIEKIREIAQSHNIKILLDAAQGAGTIKIDLKKSPFDFIAITGHKHLFGPQGTGALIIKNNEELEPLMFGGTGSQSEKIIHPDFLPDKYESGTLNTPGFAGLSAGIEFILDKKIENIIKYEKQLTDYLIKRLKEIEEITIYAPDVDRVSTVSFNVNRFQPSEVADYLDKNYRICVRSGLHCAPEAHKTINTFPNGTIRFSLSYFNTKEEIDTSINALKSFIMKNKN
ncbi:MAG: aminotransferase class V-fold PLP-dependent enzyme [Candidatus Woesearchaeota archaeon]